MNSSCKDLAWEASCPSGVTGRGKIKSSEQESSARRRQTTDAQDARRRRVVFGNVAFDIIKLERLSFEAEGVRGEVEGVRSEV